VKGGEGQNKMGKVKKHSKKGRQKDKSLRNLDRKNGRFFCVNEGKEETTSKKSPYVKKKKMI